MSSIRAMARLVRRRERDRDLAAARAGLAEQAKLAAAARRDEATAARVALDDEMPSRLAEAPDRVLDRFPVERATVSAAVTDATAAATAATRDAERARAELGARERALRTIERALERTRARHRLAEARREQLAHDDLASSRAWRAK